MVAKGQRLIVYNRERTPGGDVWRDHMCIDNAHKNIVDALQVDPYSISIMSLYNSSNAEREIWPANPSLRGEQEESENSVWKRKR